MNHEPEGECGERQETEGGLGKTPAAFEFRIDVDV